MASHDEMPAKTSNVAFRRGWDTLSTGKEEEEEKKYLYCTDVIYYSTCIRFQGDADQEETEVCATPSAYFRSQSIPLLYVAGAGEECPECVSI